MTPPMSGLIRINTAYSPWPCWVYGVDLPDGTRAMIGRWTGDKQWEWLRVINNVSRFNSGRILGGMDDER